MGDARNVAQWVRAFAEQAEKAEFLRDSVMTALARKAADGLRDTQTELAQTQKEKEDKENALKKLEADYLQLKAAHESLDFESRTRESDQEREHQRILDALRNAKAEVARLTPIETQHEALQAEHEETRYAVGEGLSQLVASSRAIAAALPPQNVTAADDDVHALHDNGYALAKDAWVLVVKQLRACAAVAQFATSILRASADAVVLLRWLSEHGVAVTPGNGNTTDDAHSLVTSAYMVAGKALGGSLVLALTLKGQIGLVGHMADPSKKRDRARGIAQGRLDGVIEALRGAFGSPSIDMAQVQGIDAAIADLRTGISEPIEQDNRPPPAAPAPGEQVEAAETERQRRLEHYNERVAREWPAGGNGQYLNPPVAGKKKNKYTPNDKKMAGLMAEGYVPEQFAHLLGTEAVAKRERLLGTPAPASF